MSRLRQLQKEAKVALPTSGEKYTSEDGTISTVLDDNFDPNYEPSTQELDDYAEWLGMSLPEDEELMWIAREGLKAPVPREWKPCKTDTGEVYYFNFKTGESLWDHPLDEYFKNKFATEKEKLQQKKAADAQDKARRDVEARERERAEARLKAEKAEREADEARKRAKEADAARARAAAEQKEAEERETAKRREAVAAAATKRVAASKAAPAAESPATSPAAVSLAADPAPSPRLMTEADKKRQAAIKKEMQDALAAKEAELQEEHAAALERRAVAHKRELEQGRSAAQLKARQAVQDAEDRVQEELETKQRQAEVRHKKTIKALEDEIEATRDKIKAVQKQQADKIARGEQELDSAVHAAVVKRVAECDAEIARERQEHSASLASRQRSEKLKLETELDVAAAAAAEQAQKQFAEAAKQRQAKHDADITKLRADRAAAMKAESERIERANHGEVAQLVLELEQRTRADEASIEAAANEELSAMRRAEEAALAEQRRVLEAQEAAASADANGADAQAEEMARSAAERHANERIEDLKQRFEAKWKECERQLLADRQAQLDQVEQATLAATGDSVDLAHLEVTLAAQRRQRAADLRHELERAYAHEAEDIKAQQARHIDAQKSRTATRRAEALEAFCEAKRREYAQQRNAASAALSSENAALASSVAAQLQVIRDKHVETLATETKKKRDRHQVAVSEAMTQLAADLMSLEQDRRREVEAETASPDKSMSDRRITETPTIQYDDSALLASCLAQLRAEFAASEMRLRSQPFLAASHAEPAVGQGSSVHAGTRPPSSQHSNSLGSIDARQPSLAAARSYVVQQEAEAEARAATLAQARASQQMRSHSAPRRSTSSLAQPEIAVVLQHLNDKVNTLLANVASPRHPQRLDSPSLLDIESPPRVHRRRSREERPSSRNRRSQSHNARASTPVGGGGGRGHAGAQAVGGRWDRDDVGGMSGAAGDDAAKALVARWNKVLHEPVPTNAGHRGGHRE